MKFGGKPYDGTKARTDLTSEAVGRETETVSLKYKEEVMVISQGYEIKAANSEFMISFTVPTVNPTVEIEMPSIQPHVWFRGAGRGSSQIQHSRKIRAKRNAFSRTVHATQMVERRLGGKSSDYFSQ
jgi:hypothetical protein